MVVIGGFALVVLSSGTSDAEDSSAQGAFETGSCLICHHQPGLARLDKDVLSLSFVSERYVIERLGAHARLPCISCHPESEVDTFPHEEISPVDCTRTCHLDTTFGARAEFSHTAVAERLDKGVHSTEALSELDLARPLLRPGQSTCLYCHDEPVFPESTDPLESPSGAGSSRCASCHDDLPVDVDYFLQHVAERPRTRGSVMRTVEVCATCHSDPALTAEMEQHDAVSSYLRSFHGKANLLGSEDAATCVDCHRTGAGDAHGMLAADDLGGSTHPDQLGATCRSGGCHPAAVPELSSASVHLQLTPLLKTPEYYVMAFFILLTLGVLAVFLALILLELCNEVVRPRDPRQRQLTALARAVQRHPDGRRMLLRQTVGQRVQHWLLATSFLVLVVTGMPLKFASEPWAEALVSALGGVAGTRTLHRASAIIISATFCFHVALLARAFFARLRAKTPDRALVRGAIDVVLEHPMVPRPRDVVLFGQLFGYLLGLRRHRPESGQHRFTQKFDYWAVFWGMLILGLSGAVLWAEAWSPSVFGGRTLNFALIMHSDEAFLAAIYIAIAHIYAVALAPRVFPLSRGSLTGDMPAEEVAGGHAGHLLEVARELGITIPPEAEPSGVFAMARQMLRRGYALVLLASIVGLATTVDALLVPEVTGAAPAVEVQHLPLHLTAALLGQGGRGGATSPGAVRLEEGQRGPVSHYHGIESWYRPDPGNTCLGSGCHQPLPHTEHPEHRSFLNMHGVFTDCRVCHEVRSTQPDIGWVSRDGDPATEPPALLRLGVLLEGPTAPSLAGVTSLVAEATDESGDEPTLAKWHERLLGARTLGPLVDQLRASIELHGPGVYGAKLGVLGPPGRWRPPSARAAGDLRAEGISDARRERLVERVHKGLTRPEVLCRRCHQDEGELVDFDALGYPARRKEQLRDNAVARVVEAVEGAEVFYLPALVGPQPSPAATEELQ